MKGLLIHRHRIIAAAVALVVLSLTALGCAAPPPPKGNIAQPVESVQPSTAAGNRSPGAPAPPLLRPIPPPPADFGSIPKDPGLRRNAMTGTLVAALLPEGPAADPIAEILEERGGTAVRVGSPESRPGRDFTVVGAILAEGTAPSGKVGALEEEVRNMLFYLFRDNPQARWVVLDPPYSPGNILPVTRNAILLGIPVDDPEMLTEDTGAEETKTLAEAVKPLGYSVYAVPYHTGTVDSLAAALGVVDPGLVLAAQGALLRPWPLPGWEVITIPSDEVAMGGCGIVSLGEKTVLVNAGAQMVSDLLAERGYRVNFVDTGDPGGPAALTGVLRRL